MTSIWLLILSFAIATGVSTSLQGKPEEESSLDFKNNTYI